MAMRQILNEIRGMKVKDAAAHVKPLLTVSNLKTSTQRALDNYHVKYIQTDSIQPLYHLCFGGMIFSYLIALPEERRHLEHQQHIKEHGGHWLLQQSAHHIQGGLYTSTLIIRFPFLLILWHNRLSNVWGVINFSKSMVTYCFSSSLAQFYIFLGS